jgi:thiol-disulfide isomerase/thioredoxin
VPEPKPEPPVIEEPEPVVEAKPEPKPALKKGEVYKTQVETMEGDENALDKLIEKANGRPLVLDFQYDACGHCQDIAPRFEELMLEYKGKEGEEPEVMFYKVDIMQPGLRPLMKELGITGMPTFLIYTLGE